MFRNGDGSINKNFKLNRLTLYLQVIKHIMFRQNFGFDIYENDTMSTFIQTLWDELGKLDLVGYESDEDILQAKQNGFYSIGKLKVWMKS